MLDFTNPSKSLEYIDRVKDPMLAGPVCAHIHLTNECTHNCRHCAPMQFRIDTEFVGLPEGRVMSLIDELHTLRTESIQFSGGGEPTVAPYFRRAISHALAKSGKDGFKSFGLVTHGGHLHKFFDLLHDKFSIRVSLDSTNKEDHAKMHQVSDDKYDRILDNIQKFCKVKKSTQLGIGFLIDVDNQMEDFPDWCDKVFSWGVDFIAVRPVFSMAGNHAPIKDRYHTLLPLFDIVAAKHGVKFWFSDRRMEGTWFPTTFNKCRASALSTILAANGQAYICCNHLHPYGNFLEKSFKDLWFNERIAYIDKLYPKTNRLCERCLLAHYNSFLEVWENNAASPAKLIY